MKFTIRDYCFGIALVSVLVFMALSLQLSFIAPGVSISTSPRQHVLPDELMPVTTPVFKPMKERDVDVKKLKKGIEQGTLSSREALFYNKMGREQKQ